MSPGLPGSNEIHLWKLPSGAGWKEVKGILADYVGREPESMTIGRRSKGKPWLPEHPELHFNMSNSGEWTALAVCTAGEVGIDLERIRFLPDMEELIRLNFSEREIRYITMAEHEKQDRFFRFWTVKEAFVKAIGEGFRIHPEQMEFRVEKGRFHIEAMYGVQEPQEWLITEAEVHPGYPCTLVHKVREVQIRNMNF